MIDRLSRATALCRRRLNVARWCTALCTHFVAGCACLMLLDSGNAFAQQEAQDLERAVKAAFVYRFLDYVEWPGAAFVADDAPIVVGVHGAPDLASELARIVSGRTAASRPIVVKPVSETDPVAGLHVLFVGRSHSPRLPAIARLAQQYSILLISESDDESPPASMINLVIREGRVKFDVHLNLAEKSGLKISSRLLAVARAVRGGGGG